MAQRRLINRSLGSSIRFLELHQECRKLGDFAQAIFPLLVVCADDHGRLDGDPMTVKLVVFPSSPHTVGDVEHVLQAMHRVGLIRLYQVGGKRYLDIANFRREQPGMKYVAKSRYPDPPAEVVQKGENRTTFYNSEDKPEIKSDQSLAGFRRISPEPAELESGRRREVRIEVRTEEPPSEVLSGPAGPDAIQAIFDHWQSRQSTVKHRGFTGETRKSVRARIQDYTPEEIKLAIDRYDSVISDTSGRYWLNYRWDLQEFLSRGAGKWLRKFLNEDWEGGILANRGPTENDGSRPTYRSGDRAADRGPLGDKRYRPRTG